MRIRTIGVVAMAVVVIVAVALGGILLLLGGFGTPVDYDTSPDNVVHLSLELRGTNEWGYGFSNSFDEFGQETEGQFTGPRVAG